MEFLFNTENLKDGQTYHVIFKLEKFNKETGCYDKETAIGPVFTDWGEAFKNTPKNSGVTGIPADYCVCTGKWDATNKDFCWEQE